MIATMERFTLAMQAAGKKQRTLQWYMQKLRETCRILSNSPPPAIHEITVDDLRRVMVELRRRGLSAHTIHGYGRTLRRFFSWCVQEGIIEVSPARRLDLPKLPKCAPKGLALDVIRRLLAQADDPRDRALLLILVDTGCRASEIVGLQRSDVDLVHGFAEVHGKGDQTRSVALNPVTVEAIRAYLSTREDGESALWMGRKGPLTYWGLRMMLARLKKRAGIRHANLHAFRHTFAREYLSNGGDLASLTDILGHSDPQVTVRFYARYKRRELLDKQRRYSPVHAL